MRQNPHVRICGGPGSATTLVYPTPHVLLADRVQRGLLQRKRVFDEAGFVGHVVALISTLAEIFIATFLKSL